IGLEIDGLAVARLRLWSLLLRVQGNAQAVVGLDIIALEADGLSEFRDGVVERTCSIKRHSQVQTCPGTSRPQRHSGHELAEGLRGVRELGPTAEAGLCIREETT